MSHRPITVCFLQRACTGDAFIMSTYFTVRLEPTKRFKSIDQFFLLIYSWFH